MRGRLRRITAHGVALVVAASFITAQAGTTLAYCQYNMTHWPETSYRMHVQYYVPSSWNSSLSSAANQWNNTSSLYYLPSFDSTQWWNFNLDNQDFSYYGYPDVPGLTQRQQISGSTHNRADVHLNNNFTWNTSGTMNQAQRKTDVWTIAVHEIGHATGLNHPDKCGTPTSAEKASVMYVDWTTKRYTNVDDDNGNRAIYP